MRAPKYSQPMRYSQVEKTARTITRPYFETLRAEVRDLKARLRKVEKEAEDKDPLAMPRSRTIDMEKVLACMDTVCPKCGRRISPAEVQRIDFTRVRCPACGEALSRASAEGRRLAHHGRFLQVPVEVRFNFLPIAFSRTQKGPVLQR
jgi:predicted RNA-binding Zn-ribbon protein involved in translation (DUF1610 family)